MQGSPEQGPGFYADTKGIHGIANQLTAAAEVMHKGTTAMRTAMFDTTTEPGRTVGPVTVFGAEIAQAAQLGQKFNDLIDELVSYGYALGDTMIAAAEQLHKTGDIYTQTDENIAGN